MGGFAAALGGLGSLLQPLGIAQRQNDLQQWGQMQQHFANLLTDAINQSTTPERQADLYKAKASLLKLRPGQDASKVIQDLQEHLSLHPSSQTAMGASPMDQAKARPTPGPLQQTAAQPANNPLSPGGASMGMMQNTAQMMGQPAIQPQEQTKQEAPAYSAMLAQQAQPAQTVAGAPAQATPVTVNPLQAVNDAFTRSLAMGSMPKPLQAPALQSIAQQAELQKAEDLARFQLREMGPERVQAIKNIMGPDGELTMPKLLQIEAMMGNQSGVSMNPMLTAMFARPTPEPIDAGMLSPEQKAMYGIPPDAAGKWTVERNRFSRQVERAYPGWAGAAATLSATGETGRQSVNQALQGGGNLTAPGGGPSVAPNQLGRLQGFDANGNYAFTTPAQVRAGQAPTSTGLTPLGALPLSRTRDQIVESYDPNLGATVKNKIPMSSTSQRVIPGQTGGGDNGPIPLGPPGQPPQAMVYPPWPVPGQASTQPSAPLIKGLTPKQQMDTQGQINTIHFALDRANKVMEHSDLLNSMISAGKIQLAISPHTGALLLSRAFDMSPEEEEMAAAFQNLAEDINLLRGPLQATGFRGPEAFAALQAQRGNLLGRPEITKQVLASAIKALNAQLQPKEGMMNTGSARPQAPQAPAGKKGDPLGIR